MIRKIIRINEDLCNGCGACANACHEGAIAMVNGKAKLIRDDYCDGLGNCLPACPTGAISFEEREAAAYDEAAVARHMEARKQEQQAQHAGGCPGSRIRQFNMDGGSRAETAAPGIVPSQLRQWPVQIKLAPINAPYFDGANLLVAADCTAYAYGNFHQPKTPSKPAANSSRGAWSRFPSTEKYEAIAERSGFPNFMGIRFFHPLSSRLDSVSPICYNMR